VDRYKNAPAMQVAHRSHVINMLSAEELRRLIELEKPNIIVPEIEAIATEVLIEFEKKGVRVIPNANAVHITMNRERIRDLASNELKLPTTKFRFADNLEQLISFVNSDIGYPCVVKPIMSSSGKGQSVIKSFKDISNAWDFAQEAGRAGKGRVIVEEYLDFDFEITLLTVRSKGLISFCPPIGHKQKDGDYIESWQPQLMSEETLKKSQEIAEKVVNKLSGNGIFGVELFIKDQIPFFSEVSPRPHDTGMVTMISQELSEFSLHARAILNLPVPKIINAKPSASVVIKGEGSSDNIVYQGIDDALSEEHSQIRLFGKPSIKGKRRLGVLLASDKNSESALKRAKQSCNKIKMKFL
jgi:phosphoribosylglycinamide formyltransferase 2